jgi:hypothetical protein
MDLAALKRKYRFIFCTQFADKLVYWRPLTLREHDIYTKIIAMDLSPIGEVQDTIFRDIVLNPDIIDEMNLMPPGVVPSIVNAALFVCGNLLQSEADMIRMNSDIEEMRKAISANPYEQFILLICKAFPTYTPSDIEELEYQEMLRLLVMAEKMTGMEDPIKLKPAKKEGSATDHLFQDRKAAEQVDRGAPAAEDIRDIIARRQGADLSPRQTKQAEMIERIRDRARSRG